MIKIDFHIHTISTCVDSQFSFSIDKLIRYVNEKKLDAIAITNHNIFVKNNFLLIKNALNITVFPGIEITLESGHMLVIGNFDDIDSFESSAKIIETEFQKNKNISFDCFQKAFVNLSNVLLIPHYEKKPKIPNAILDKLGSNFYCGEVANSKKFVRLQKENKPITPVFFSDLRIDTSSKLSSQQTFLDTNDCSFGSIKEALRDKNKVYLNAFKKKDLFPILDDGTLASTGLNLIFGKRSSGKTHTLDLINENFDNVKYIRQFELIESDKNKAEREFNALLSKEKSLFADEYLQEFKDIVNEVCLLNFRDFEVSADSYISSLQAFAIDADKLDSFAKVPVFSEQEYEFTSDEKITKLIEATIELIEADSYKELVDKFIQTEILVNLLIEFNEIFVKNKKQNLAFEKTNEIIKVLKKDLTLESSQTSIASFNISEFTRQILTKRYFVKICKTIENITTLQKQSVGKFNIVAIRKPIESAIELGKIVSKQGEYRSSFNLYDNPYEYLLSLKEKQHISDDIIYKCFIDIDYKVLNQNDLPVSGGERAEYNLERKLSDAENYEMLLVDEPESSFDNVFLRTDISSKLFELSKRMPVFVSTHNSVIGGCLNANFVLYTNRCSDDAGNISFSIYSGQRDSKTLFDTSGNKIENYLVLMNCLEGGEESYGERKQSYQNLKN